MVYGYQGGTPEIMCGGFKTAQNHLQTISGCLTTPKTKFEPVPDPGYHPGGIPPCTPTPGGPWLGPPWPWPPLRPPGADFGGFYGIFHVVGVIWRQNSPETCQICVHTSPESLDTMRDIKLNILQKVIFQALLAWGALAGTPLAMATLRPPGADFGGF